MEIYLQREFRFEDGLVMRFRIEGIEANLCYSHIFDQWRIPPDARNQISIFWYLRSMAVRQPGASACFERWTSG